MTQPMLTMEQFQKVLPKQVKSSVSDCLVDRINNTLGDPELMDSYRDNLLSYTSVMADGKFKIQGYVDAVRYVSYKLMGASNIDSWVKTFPDRYQILINKNAASKDIAAHVTAYNKTKLVNLIFEQTLVPSHILNADMYQKALNTQCDLMQNANSEKVRSDAANSLLTHLKAPETKKIELDIAMKQDKSIDDLRATTLELVAQQRAMIQAGASSAKDVAHSKLLIDNESGDVV